jgi:hypothetical protein
LLPECLCREGVSQPAGGREFVKYLPRRPAIPSLVVLKAAKLGTYPAIEARANSKQGESKNGQDKWLKSIGGSIKGPGAMVNPETNVRVGAHLPICFRRLWGLSGHQSASATGRVYEYTSFSVAPSGADLTFLTTQPLTRVGGLKETGTRHNSNRPVGTMARGDAKMKNALALIAMVASILSIDAPFTGNHAVAASARCAAFCSNWCAKNFAMKNPTACSERCQEKHCK